ncbi:unnamed protein product [Rotaria socialis]|uniref:Uncharacterized protein n=1 Tax=Rotaria socialis TaxID=392032 RepID=A0A820RUI6_9BILA|nr:unnamed protein product [Rotaria socialis]CAF3429048.1 unnamed protein product [Rotaria socialis]CAF3441579.1 unnamed protein product [Rotaria socialis]CAF4355340.1 unnamed protein product [Rotaria socialis]CAF4443645.1 unnamed protein product [Rotaria socialis]
MASDQKIVEILQSNNAIKQSTIAIVKDYLKLQDDFFKKVSCILEQLDTIQCVANVFLTDDEKKLLNEFKPAEKVQLAICGYNSTGKTTFVHELLKCGSFLPTGIGAVSARIIKFSYAAANEACLLKYQSVLDSNEPEETVNLSLFFTNSKSKENIRNLRETVKKYVARPTIDKMSDEFEQWASHFIEIRIPSPLLQLGIDVYDTPGFLGTDPPILAKNLLNLVSKIRPSLLYLYDNALVSDDSRKCFEQLQLALRHHFRGTAIFFLNTKADVLTIRNDSEEDDDNNNNNEDEHVLNKERQKRYNLLLDVSEMSSTISDGKRVSLDQCDCFDIFSSQGSADRMEVILKEHAYNTVVRFAVKHDLRSTKQIIDVIVRLIDDFFDFVLITNRRSEDAWKKMRDYSLQWIDGYFAAYQSNIHEIAREAKRRLPKKFDQHRDEIEKRTLSHCETTWWEKMIVAAKLEHSIPSSASIDYINMLVENEVIKPILDEITMKMSKNAKEQTDQNKEPQQTNKNELLMAAYRKVMMNNGDYGSFYSPSSLGLFRKIQFLMLSPAILIAAPLNYLISKQFSRIHGRKSSLIDSRINRIEAKRKYDAHEYLNDIQENMRDFDQKIKENMQKWLEKNRDEFILTVDNYCDVVLQTLDKRQMAYNLARQFAPCFARIECCLVSNLDLCKHDGEPISIQRDNMLSSGGFFNIYPAKWNLEENLVVKELIRPMEDLDIGYLEAHFHRTATRLQIPHMVPLQYLYEIATNPHQISIVLPRYSKSLHSYLMNQMQHVSIDKAVQISLDISRVIANMHSYELVHRDVKVENILLDDKDQVFLADFGTCQHGTENSTFIGSRPFVPEVTTGDHQYSYQGSAFDVFCLGVLMYVVAPKDSFHRPRVMKDTEVKSLDRTRVPENYCRLIYRCITTDPAKRPTANEVVRELETIANEVDHLKPCLVCMSAPRAGRCLPCKHKTMCIECLTNLQQTSTEPQCIICREIFTSTEMDDDFNTFIAPARTTVLNQ